MVMQDPLGMGFTITTKDVYVKVENLETYVIQRMTELSDKLGDVSNSVRMISVSSKLDGDWRSDIEDRVRKNERFRYSYPATLITSLVALLIAIVSAIRVG